MGTAHAEQVSTPPTEQNTDRASEDGRPNQNRVPCFQGCPARPRDQWKDQAARVRRIYPRGAYMHRAQLLPDHRPLLYPARSAVKLTPSSGLRELDETSELQEALEPRLEASQSHPNTCLATKATCLK